MVLLLPHPRCLFWKSCLCLASLLTLFGIFLVFKYLTEVVDKSLHHTSPGTWRNPVRRAENYMVVRNYLPKESPSDDENKAKPEQREDRVSTPTTYVGTISSADESKLDLQDGAVISSTDVIQQDSEQGAVTDKSIRKVILLTYGRSGSSLVGAIFDYNPAVYYVFEPLYVLEGKYNSMHTSRAEYKEIIFNPQYRKIGATIIAGLLNCNFTSEVFLEHVYVKFLEKSRGTQSLKLCFKKKSNRMLLGNHNWQCLRNGEVNCASSKLLFLKVIRYDLGSLDSLMTTHPDLTILYLTRDPRAVLHSQTKAFNGYFRSYLQTYIEKSCQMRERDLLSVFAFAHKFPHRIKVVRYEDLVQAPTFVARKLFDFVGLSFTDNDAGHVRLLTEASDANKTFIDVFSVARTNSSATAYKWRERMDWNLVTMVQNYCYNWMADLGYKHVTDLSELRNQSLSIKHKVYISRNIQLP